MKVGVIGLGNMGAAIAERVLAAGHELTVYNRTPGKADELVALGAAPAASPRDLASGVDVCITAVAGDAALEAVTTGEDGILTGAGPSTVLVDTSTVSPSASSRVARAAEAAAVDYLRAPVSGNPTVVRAGNLTIIVSGPRPAFEKLEPLLREIGPNVYYTGPGEEARVIKLALQLMIGGTAELLAEALLLGEAAGVGRAQLLTVIGNSAVGSPFVKYKTGPLLEDDYSPTFTTAMMRKDLDLVSDLGAESGVPLPLIATLKERVRETIDAGYGDADFMALFLQLQSAAGRAVPPVQ